MSLARTQTSWKLGSSLSALFDAFLLGDELAEVIIDIRLNPKLCPNKIDRKEAIQYRDNLVAHTPHHAQQEALIALLYYYENDQEKALKYTRKIIAENEDSSVPSSAQRLMGNILQETKDENDLMIRWYERAAEQGNLWAEYELWSRTNNLLRLKNAADKNHPCALYQYALLIGDNLLSLNYLYQAAIMESSLAADALSSYQLKSLNLTKEHETIWHERLIFYGNLDSKKFLYDLAVNEEKNKQYGSAARYYKMILETKKKDHHQPLVDLAKGKFYHLCAKYGVDGTSIHVDIDVCCQQALYFAIHPRYSKLINKFNIIVKNNVHFFFEKLEPEPISTLQSLLDKELFEFFCYYPELVRPILSTYFASAVSDIIISYLSLDNRKLQENKNTAVQLNQLSSQIMETKWDIGWFGSRKINGIKMPKPVASIVDIINEGNIAPKFKRTKIQTILNEPSSNVHLLSVTTMFNSIFQHTKNNGNGNAQIKKGP